MKLLRNNDDLAVYLSSLSGAMGLVPTMGYLHPGHGALLKAARAQNQAVLMTIFVNPTQFNEADDFQSYPRDEARDLAMVESLGVDAVWMPEVDAIYPPGDTFCLHEKNHNTRMEGIHRPGHFYGVATVVLKLCLLAKPQRIYMGEKDYQQLQLVRDLVASFFLPIEVIEVPTQREVSGLAMSSRNVRLTKKQRKQAAKIYQALCEQPNVNATRQVLNDLGFRVDYVEEYQGRRYVAAWLGRVRLIDNVALDRR